MSVITLALFISSLRLMGDGDIGRYRAWYDGTLRLILRRLRCLEKGNSAMTRAKIKIEDCPELRADLDTEYEGASQVQLCRYALALARHMLEVAAYVGDGWPVLEEAFAINEQWQRGEARMHDVRQAGFRVHQLAKVADGPIQRTALRVAGQAVGTGHMREHAMVASDYAVKTVNLMHPGDLDAVRTERHWQIEHLRVAKDMSDEAT